MSIFYKMRCQSVFQRMSFNGSDISVEEVKSEILKKNRFGKSNDFELQLINADTGKVFGDDKAMILKNTSVLYARIPRVLKKRTPKTCNKNKVPQNKNDSNKYVNPDFSLLKNDAEKIDAMMHQSTVDYNAVNYPTEVVNKKMPQHYVCRKCHIPGHYIGDCPLGENRMPIKRSSGIPRTFMEPVTGPEVEGAMLMGDGSFARRRNGAPTRTDQNVRAQRIAAVKPY